MDFQNSPPFERCACFYVTVTENFKGIQYFNFETNSLKNENLFQKLKQRFAVESIKIEKATFRHKTALSDDNVKTYKMGSVKQAYHKGRSFASN